MFTSASKHSIAVVKHLTAGSIRAFSADVLEPVVKSKIVGNVGVIEFNRPKALNALRSDVLEQLKEHALALDRDSSVGAIVLTGSQKAFAAGADIKEMQNLSFSDAYHKQLFAGSQEITKVKKPVIAAVNGYALGGGFEIALACDFIIAGKNAKFGLPEVTLGTIPGGAGSQRLTRAVGKAKAMELILTGRQMTADEAERSGVVARVVDDEATVDDAIKTASKIASYSHIATQLAKKAVNLSYETSLAEGIEGERQIFYATFATEDQKEGMTAFVEKRKAEWKNQ